MPNISDIQFLVKFDLTAAPTLVLTDGSTIPSGAVGRFSITLPDNYTRVGDFTSPDISSSGAAFSYPLRLDSKGQVQTGQYTIKYEIKTSDGVISTFTRLFQFTYTPVSLVMTENFDVFTPSLSYKDDTIYQASGFNSGTLTRSWSASSIPTGVISGSGVTLDLIHSGHYYDANYSISLTSSILYTHQTYTWLTVQETISKSISTYAATPPSLVDIVTLISNLKTKLDSLSNTIQPYYDTKEDLQTAQTYFGHIVDKIRVSNTDSIYIDLKNLIAILHNNQIPTYTALNIPILPYDLTSFSPGAVWGNITGVVSNQTDLVAYIAAQIAAGSFTTNIGDGTNTTYSITHNLNSSSVNVTLVENLTGEIVFTTVTVTSANAISLTFAAAPTSNQYKVIVKK
jgi:hypothetical protein